MRSSLSSLDCGSDGEAEDALPGLRYKKTVRLGSEDIAQLGLKDGANHVTFSVTTSYQVSGPVRNGKKWEEFR